MKKLLYIFQVLVIGNISNAQNWVALGTGTNGIVRSIATYNGELYAAGTFTTAGGNAVNNIAKWNGTSWSDVGSGMNNDVYALSVYNGNLYAGGLFTTAGGVTVNYIAKWNGSSWSTVGTGMNFHVLSLYVFNGELYAGGSFDIAGGITAHRIAKWDGISWSSLGSGIAGPGQVYVIGSYNGELYAGGNFTSPASRIAKWDGTSWSAVGGGIGGNGGSVYAFVVYNSELYVGGYFTAVGGSPVNRIARWNGTSWSDVGSGMDNGIIGLTLFNGEVYAGGQFTTAGGNPANRIAKWNGVSWSAVGSGMNDNQVAAFAEYNTELHAGGLFTMAGGNPANCIAKWINCSGIPPQPGAITGNTSVCQGSSQTYSISPVSGATSYTWMLPSGWTGTSTTNSITVTAGASSGNISVTANNSCGSSTPQTLAVTVNPVPPQPGTITGNNSVCSGNSQTYSISAVSGATSYTWSLPSGWTGTSTTNSITVTVGASSGNISVTANNSCGSSIPQTLAVIVNAIPSQPGAITGSNSVCQGSTQTYSVSPVNGATSYSWTLPSGWTGSSATTSITATVGAASGNISITANNNCGISAAQTLAVIVNTIPAQPGSITGSNSVCQGSSKIYSVSPVSGATSYSWTLPAGWTGTSSTNSITAIAGANSGNISVTAINSCGTGSAQNLAITVNTTPAQPGNITGNAIVYIGQNTNYSIGPVSGATGYTWSLNGGGTIASGQNTTGISVNWATAGNYTLSVNAVNSCGASADQTMSIAVSSITATSDPGNPFEITTGPNPTPGEFYLRAKGVINKKIRMVLINLSGQPVYQFEQKAGTNDYIMQINIASLASGIYKLEIFIDKKVFFKTIAKLN